MGKFSLNDILSERSKAQDMQSEEIRTDGMVELIDIYKMIPSQENFYDVTKYMDLVNSIKLFGILQPLLLTESEEEDMYGINAGHRRREACLYLVEQEGLEKYRYVPAIVKPHQDDVMENLTIIMANRFRNKTDWEKMQEVVKTEALLAELKGNKSLNRETKKQLKELLGIEGEQNLKTRDFVAEILGMSATQVGRYNAIYKNLSWECMEAFKRGFVNVSVAYEIAGLSPEWQMEAFEMLQKNGSIQISDITKLKQQERESKPIAGQQTLDETITSHKNEEQEKDAEVEERKTQVLKRTCGATQQPCNFEENTKIAKALGVECKVNCCAACKEQCGARCHYATQQNKAVAEPEQFEAKPEYKDILCYSCLHYDECDKKAGTVFTCASYTNKAQSEKTSEQLYSEEQDRIDRETAKKIEEMRQKDIEEKSLPSGDKREPRDDFEITVTMRQYSEVYYGHINFLVTLKKDYRFDDTITLKEYRQGEPTGREIMVKVKNVVQDCTGIEDKYCVIGFYTVQK